MRVIVYGAGAIGGVLGGRLATHGLDVVLIARGAHLEAIRADGLVVEDPEGTATVAVEAVGHPGELTFGDGDVVVLAMKSQDTVGALEALRGVASPALPIVCAQNGVANERAALRRFPDVYGMCVMCPATHLAPGVVQASSTPVTGLMDLGRWPEGSDATAEALAAVLSASSFSSVARPDIARWKWRKLLMNLGNAVQAACGNGEDTAPLLDLVVSEGRAALAKAGIEAVSDDEARARRAGLLTPRPVGGVDRSGGSTWQSLARGLSSVETDYLSGEIVLLGRLHDLATPANALLQRVVAEMSWRHEPPGSRKAADLLEAVRRAPTRAS